MVDVLIVDDEFMIRDGLRTLINWEKLGFKVIGVAENGRKALELYQSYQPKVILADIQMPYMNGLELLAAIKKYNRSCYFIILTGHDDFSYAKKSINLGVYAYLLKPVEPKELENTLKNIKKDYDQKAQSLKGLNQFVGNMTDNSFIELQSFFSNIVTGSTNINANLASKYSLKGMFFTLALFHSDKNSAYSTIELLASVYHKKYNHKIFWVKYSSNSIMFVSVDTTYESSKSRLEDYIKNFKPSGQTSIIQGHTCQNVNGIIHSFNSIIIKQSRSILRTTFRITNLEDYKRDYRNTKAARSKINNGFVNLSKSEFVDGMTMLSIALKHAHREVINRILSREFVSILYIVDESGSNLSELFNNPLHSAREIFFNEEIEKMISRFRLALEKAFDYLKFKREGQPSEIIEKAEGYIQKNLNNPSLSQKEVSAFVGLSPSYFSTLFKKEKGVKFIEFLINLRVQTAIMLLATKKYSALEVSFMVGYSNYNCFSTIFKKYTGLPPTQYSKQNY